MFDVPAAQTLADASVDDAPVGQVQPGQVRAGTATTSAAAAAAQEFRGVVLGLDVATASDDELLALAPVLEGVRRAVDAALGSSLGELDVRGTTDERFGHRTATWFATATIGSRADAKRRVLVGRRLARLEVVRGSLAEGDVSFDHARLLADLAVPRNAAVVERLQSELVCMAAVLPFERWRAEVRGIVDLFDPDGGHRPGPETSTLQLATGFGGSLEVAGTFCGLDGTALHEAVDAHADQLRLRYRDDVRAGALDEVPTRAELRAEALAALVRQGVAAGSAGSAPVTDLTLVAHATDPLGRTARHAHPGQGTTRHGSPSPVPHGPGAQVPGAQVRGAHGPGAPGRGGPGAGAGCGHVDLSGTGMTPVAELSDATVRTLCCDPVISTVVVDSLGNPVDLGRSTRLVPRRLRRALQVRDGGCVFPGCDAPASWCDAHHVVHWADGGATSADNLALLCRHHHGTTHRRGWTMEADPRAGFEQRFTWTRPDGRTIHSQRASDHTHATQTAQSARATAVGRTGNAPTANAPIANAPPGPARE
ncbi:MAG: DUF222 domain-containing protein [Actinomycetes bacterium]